MSKGKKVIKEKKKPQRSLKEKRQDKKQKREGVSGLL